MTTKKTHIYFSIRDTTNKNKFALWRVLCVFRMRTVFSSSFCTLRASPPPPMIEPSSSDDNHDDHGDDDHDEGFDYSCLRDQS